MLTVFAHCRGDWLELGKFLTLTAAETFVARHIKRYHSDRIEVRDDSGKVIRVLHDINWRD